jgi:hypothetical protein
MRDSKELFVVGLGDQAIGSAYKALHDFVRVCQRVVTASQATL